MSILWLILYVIGIFMYCLAYYFFSDKKPRNFYLLEFGGFILSIVLIFVIDCKEAIPRLLIYSSTMFFHF